MKLATKLTWMMLLVLLLVGSSTAFFGYRAAYKQVEEAAGIELVGCANITTGLLNPSDIAGLASGDSTKRNTIQKTIGWIVEHKPIFKEAFILSLDGTILAADSHLQKRGYKAGDPFYFSDMDKKMITGMKHSTYSNVYTYDGTSLKTGYGPIYQDHDPSKPIIALMAISFDGSIVQKRTMDVVLQPLLIGTVILIIAIAAAYLSIRRMTLPLTRLSQSVNRVAQGDLTQNPVLLDSKDEIGTLARDFNGMTHNLRLLITEVNDTSHQVAASSAELTASAQETNRAGEHNTTITLELSDGASAQLHHLEGGYQAVQDMSRLISEIAKMADTALTHSSTNAEKARTGRDVIDSATGQLMTMSGSMSMLSGIIHRLSGHSKEIESIAAVISSIAEETRLLSLNAAIEAARAGTEGRGFAVVAQSVRKLAERSAESSAQIGGLIQRIVGQMGRATEMMTHSNQEMEHSSALMDRAGTSFSEIEHSVSDMAEQSRQISSVVGQLADLASGLVTAIRDIVQVSNQTAASAESLSASFEQQLAAMEEVEASASILSALAEKLRCLVERFAV